jgi:hypothetical protein
MRADGKSILQLAKDSHHGVVCVIRARIKKTVSQQNRALTFLILRRNMDFETRNKTNDLVAKGLLDLPSLQSSLA